MWNFRPTSELYHYGVKGMKWGVRKDRKSSGSSGRGIRKTISDKRQKRALDKKLKGFEKKVQSDWVDTYNKASEKFRPELQRINDSFGEITDKNRKTYYRTASDTWMSIYKDQSIKDFGKHPIDNGKDWVSIMPMMYMYEYY